MINHEDQALTLSNPRLLAAIYFAALSIVITLFLYNIIELRVHLRDVISLAHATLLAAVIAGSFGALFGERIVHCHAPYRLQTFLWGILMTLAALPFYDLGLMILLCSHHPAWLQPFSIAHMFSFYAYLLLYSLLLIGIGLSVLAGIAAMVLRSHLVYYFLRSLG